MEQAIVWGTGVGPHLSPASHSVKLGFETWHRYTKLSDQMGWRVLQGLIARHHVKNFPFLRAWTNILYLLSLRWTCCHWALHTHLFPSVFLPFSCSALCSPLPMVHWGLENMLSRNMLALSSHRIPLQQGSIRLQSSEAAPCVYLSVRTPLTTRLLCKTGAVPQWVKNGWCKPSEWDFPRGMSAEVKTHWCWRSHR